MLVRDPELREARTVPSPQGRQCRRRAGDLAAQQASPSALLTALRVDLLRFRLASEASGRELRRSFAEVLKLIASIDEQVRGVPAGELLSKAAAARALGVHASVT